MALCLAFISMESPEENEMEEEKNCPNTSQMLRFIYRQIQVAQ
jgi:hypothetical protein